MHDVIHGSSSAIYYWWIHANHVIIFWTRLLATSCHRVAASGCSMIDDWTTWLYKTWLQATAKSLAENRCSALRQVGICFSVATKKLHLPAMTIEKWFMHMSVRFHDKVWDSSWNLNNASWISQKKHIPLAASRCVDFCQNIEIMCRTKSLPCLCRVRVLTTLAFVGFDSQLFTLCQIMRHGENN